MPSRRGFSLGIKGIFGLSLVSLIISLQAQAYIFDPGINQGYTYGVDSNPGYLGALVGINSSLTPGASNATAIGVTLGYKTLPMWGVGIFASYFGQTTTSTFLGLPSNTAMSVITTAAQLNYFIRGLHLGIEAGISIRTWSGALSSLLSGNATTNFVPGFNFGYDYYISRNLTIGAEAHIFLPTTSSEAGSIQAFGVLKVWL